jgi:hypothetical protein
MQTGVLVDLNLANLVTQSLGVDFSTSTAVLVTQQSGDAQGQATLDPDSSRCRSPTWAASR